MLINRSFHHRRRYFRRIEAAFFNRTPQFSLRISVHTRAHGCMRRKSFRLTPTNRPVCLLFCSHAAFFARSAFAAGHGRGPDRRRPHLPLVFPASTASFCRHVPPKHKRSGRSVCGHPDFRYIPPPSQRLRDAFKQRQQRFSAYRRNFHIGSGRRQPKRLFTARIFFAVTALPIFAEIILTGRIMPIVRQFFGFREKSSRFFSAVSKASVTGTPVTGTKFVSG